VLLVAIVCLARAPAVSAAGNVGALTAAASAVLGQSKQYHHGSTVQYQERGGLPKPVSAPSPKPVSAPNSAPNAARELADTLISPFFDFDFAVSNVNLQKSAISQSDSPIDIANYRSIDGQILALACVQRSCFNRPDPPTITADTTNERFMIRLGGLFGIFYVAFLAVWFWVTRVRGRPPMGART
jgi:hypothetical protein